MRCTDAAEKVATGLRGGAAAAATASPPGLRRNYTLGGGALEESLTTEELPSTQEEDFEHATSFKSVLFVDGQHAARVALPPVSACLLIASQVSMAVAVANLWLREPLERVGVVLPIEPGAFLEAAVVLRMFVPLDVALIAVVNDLMVANAVAVGVRPGFYYLAVALRVVLWSFSLTMLLRLLGLGSPSGSSNLLTAYGVLGVGLTLSLQQTAKDLLSTLQLFLTRPYDVGDLIDAGHGHYGHVITVGWRFTTLRLLSSGQHCAIPNVALADARIQNFSRIGDASRRGKLHVTVAHSTPVRTLRQIPKWLDASATEARFTVKWSYLTGTTDKGHEFTAVVVGPRDATEWDGLKQEALFALLERLAEAEVALPAGMDASPVALVK